MPGRRQPAHRDVEQCQQTREAQARKHEEERSSAASFLRVPLDCVSASRKRAAVARRRA